MLETGNTRLQQATVAWQLTAGQHNVWQDLEDAAGDLRDIGLQQATAGNSATQERILEI